MLHGEPPAIFNDYISKYGYNADIDTTTDPEAVWVAGGLITWPSSAAVPVITSSSTNDDGDPAGTGAQTIVIQGVDATYTRKTETITMDGTSNVNASGAVLFVDRAYVDNAGTLGVNDGDITITVGGNETARIAAGTGQTLQAAMVVPDVGDRIPYLLSCWCGAAKVTGAYAIANLWRQPNGKAKRIQMRATPHTEGSTFLHKYTTPIALTPGDRLWWEAEQVSANDTEVYAGFEIAWL